MNREHLMIGSVLAGTLLLIGGLTLIGSRPRKPIEDVLAACVQHTGLGMHIHPHVRVVFDGKEETIPANIGITTSCMRPIHTHDTTGVIHLEFPVTQDVPLRELFRVWGKPLSRTHILDRAIGENDVLRVTVNGTETSELENLILHDEDKIVLEVKKKGEVSSPSPSLSSSPSPVAGVR